MSWDFSMTADLGGPEPVTIFDDLNYTYNVMPMYVLAFDDPKGIRVLSGLTGAEAQPILQRAITRMTIDADTIYEPLNPANGWGNYTGALRTLKILLGWCTDAPRARLEIH